MRLRVPAQVSSNLKSEYLRFGGLGVSECMSQSFKQVNQGSGRHAVRSPALQIAVEKNLLEPFLYTSLEVKKKPHVKIAYYNDNRDKHE